MGIYFTAVWCDFMIALITCIEKEEERPGKLVLNILSILKYSPMRILNI